MRCPDGHSWWRCAHPELAYPTLGKVLMTVGAIQAAIGLLMIMGVAW